MEQHEQEQEEARPSENQSESLNVLRIRNIETTKPPPNIEEQIIKKRGRRKWEKCQPPVPKTPPKRLKRQLDDNSKKLINESPFTKCLRTIIKSEDDDHNDDTSISTNSSLSSSSTTSSSSIKRILRSSDSHKSFYYSPHPPYNLRSRDNHNTSDNDSGIDIITPQQQQSSSSSTNIKRINRVRRRFTFD